MSQKSWRLDEVERVKSKILGEIKDLESQAEPRQVGSYLLERVNALANTATPGHDMERFVYCVHALNQQRKHGAFSQPEINALSELAVSILLANGIKPGSSTLSSLYGDVYIMLSEIAAKDGEIFAAALEQRVGNYMARGKMPGGEALQSLLFAQSSLRLGHTELALSYFDQARAELDGANQQRAQIGFIRTLRLTQRITEAREAITALEAGATHKDLLKELSWERRCLDHLEAEESTVESLIKSVHKDKDYYEASYILEVFLWTYASQAVKLASKLPSFKSLTAKKDLAFKPYGAYFRICQTIEKLYDNDIAFPKRLQMARDVLKSIHKIAQVDKELLAWLALTRWFYRHQSFDLAALTFLEYQALSSRLTQNRSLDGLKLAADLSDRAWFTHRSSYRLL